LVFSPLGCLGSGNSWGGDSRATCFINFLGEDVRVFVVELVVSFSLKLAI
jgi:hypothetical protein